MHLWWKSETNGVYSAYERLAYQDGSTLTVTLSDVTASNQALPQILEFSHDYSSVIYEGDSFWFSFANATDGHPNVVPSHNPNDASDLGRIEVVQSIIEEIVLLNQTLTHDNEEPNQGYVKWQKDGEQAGKWFIEGIILTPGSCIHINFYSNSFSYTDGTNRYYLFGDYATVQKVYQHELVVVEHLIKESTSSVKDILQLNIDMHDNNDLNSGTIPYYSILASHFTYNSISLSLYVSGQTCETPHATVNLYNTVNSIVYVSDINLKNCTAGSLMADSVIKLTHESDTLLTLYQTDITLGTIGWNEAWDIWYGSTSNDWSLCSSSYPYYAWLTGEWVEGTYQKLKTFTDYQHEIDSSYYTQKYMIMKCPFSYFSNEDNRCSKCFEEWTQWTGFKPEECTLCNFPSPFLLGNSCVDECPDDLYDYDYINYEWVPSDYYDAVVVSSTLKCQTSSLSSKDNLSVYISLKEVSSTIMINAGGTLVMNINNKRGNITSYKFTQITPTPDPNDELTNLFPLIDGTTNQYLNETKTVDLNPEAIENYVQGTIFKVMAEVENDCGDKALDYITFVLNPTPSIGTATITCPSSPWAVLEDITVTLTGNWYSENIYEMELYIKVSLELPDGTTVLLVPEQWEETTFTFTMPVVSTVNETVEARLLITAINLHDNTSTLNKSLTIDNTLLDEYESILFPPGIDLTDLSDLALLSSQMQLLLKSPQNILNNNGRVCHRDSDCSNHGICIDSGLACQWDDGYSGVDCSMNSQIFSSLSNLVEEAIDFLSGELVTESYIRRSSIQMKFEILTGLLIRPELYEYEQVLGLTEIIEEMASYRDSVMLTLPFSFDEICAQFVSRYYTRIMYELYLPMKHYNETEFASTPAAHSSYSDKLIHIRSETETAWTAFEKYFIRASGKLNSKNSFFKYSTDIVSLKAEYKIANTLNGTTYTINSDKGYTVFFPVDLFSGSTLTDMTNSVRIVAISWMISPKMLSNEDSYKLVSDIVSIHIVDSDSQTIQISNKEISLALPYSFDCLEESTDLSWKAWSLEVDDNIMNDAEWTVTMSDNDQTSFANCEEWESSYKLSISTTHLSSFALIEPTSNDIRESEYKGIGDKKSKPLNERPLYKTKGMILFYSLTFWYLLGMLVFLKIDKNTV